MRVVDASALGAVAFDEPSASDVIEAIRGRQLHAPAILPFELANVAWKHARVYPDLLEVIAGDLAGGLAIAVSLREVDFLEVLALAVAHDLSAYDASYLWLAHSLGAPLVTLDRRLRTIANGA